jgi:hypothetical protein
MAEPPIPLAAGKKPDAAPEKPPLDTRNMLQINSLDRIWQSRPAAENSAAGSGMAAELDTRFRDERRPLGGLQNCMMPYVNDCDIIAIIAYEQCRRKGAGIAGRAK